MDTTLKDYGHGSGSTVCYIVEARSTLGRPVQHPTGMLLDGRWQQVDPTLGRGTGVPVHLFNAEAVHQGFLNYGAAMALAHWFLAMENTYSGTEVRLVRVEYAYTYKTTELGVGPAITHYREEGGGPYHPRERTEAADGQRSAPQGA